MLLSNDNVNLVNEKNTDEYTPFHLIASRKPKNAIDKINIHNIARFLVQKGADFLARDTFGWTALTLATQYKNFDMQEQLSNIEIYGRNRPYLPPTKIAIEAGDITALQSLITAGTKLEYVDIIFGIVAAGSMFASDQKYEVLEFILREGKFDINTPESGAPCLPIHIAIEGQNDPKALQILIKYGARVNIPNSKGLYPIDMAAVCNNFDIAKILINNGAKVHNHLYTINMAIKNNNPEMVKLLLENGANPNQAHFKETTPLVHALQGRKQEIAKILIDGGADVSQNEILKMASSDKEIYQFLSDNSSDFLSHAINFAASALPISIEELEQTIIAGHEEDLRDIE